MSQNSLQAWRLFATARPTLAQLVIFSAVNVGLTLFQLVLMPLVKAMLTAGDLQDRPFQAVPIGDGFVFDYPGGALPDGGGGLAYFLAVQITLGVAQVVNFFAQRNVTFKSDTNPWWAALWYALAYVVISVAAAALQTVYKAPVYDLFMVGWGMGAAGEAVADVTTMLINALISCAVFFPIFKLIFRRSEDQASVDERATV